MIYGSICSGIEAASVAWRPLGWKPAFLAEIARFPSAVLSHHYPDTPNLGDIRLYENWPDAKLNGLVGGTPCQSFSYAGNRAGFCDERGNLAFTYLAIIGRYRPDWFLWENAPGLLSVNGGRDFGAVLGRMAKLGYGFAYKIFDAGYFGVFQRRRRLFVFGYYGDWRRAAAVLFERAAIANMRREVAGIPCVDASGLAKKQTMPERGRCWTVHDGNGHRFLTPLEVERLFGLPDGYTNVPVDGKPPPDGPRYKALGNSIAVPVLTWLGRRIEMDEAIAAGERRAS